MTSGAIRQDRAVSVLGMTLGTITVTGILGTGGHASVFSGFCSVSRERVAVKVLCDLRNLKRFRGEYRTLRQVKNPHVVRVHSYGATPVHHYVMDFLPGQSLDAYLKAQGGKVSEVEAIQLALQLCDGLAALHDAGIVHRDINLNNAIVGPRGHVTLFDLGIAKRLPRFYDLLGSITDPHLRAITTGTLGTPGFIAPEVFAGESATEQADIFALGVTLHVLITGKKLNYSLELDSSVSESTRNIIAFATTRQTSHRYSSVETVAEDLAERLLCLQHLQSSQPASSPVPSSARKFPMWRLLGALIGFVIPFVLLALRPNLAELTRTASTEQAGTIVTEGPTPPPPRTKVQPPPRAVVTQVLTPPPVDTATAVAPETVTENADGPTDERTGSRPITPVVAKAKPRRKHSRKNAGEEREFRSTLQRLLRVCVVPPQTVRYRVGGGRVRLKFSNPVGEFNEGCVRNALPKNGRFSGVLKPGGKR